MDLIEILRGVHERNAERVANIKDDQLTDPSDCTDWSVRDLLNHVIGENFMFGKVAGGEELDRSQPPPDFVAMGDLAGTFRASVDAAMAGWTSEGAMEREMSFAFGTMPGKHALRAALLEAVVHGFDIAKSTGQDTSIPDELAGPILSGAKMTIPPGVRPPGLPFGPEITPPEDASLGDQLVAYLGRQP